MEDDVISIQAGTQALCSVAVAVAAKEHPAHPVCFPTPPIYWEDSCSRLVVLLLAAKTMPSSNRSSLSCRNASPTTMYTMLSGLLHSVTAPPLQSWASMAGMLLWYHRPPSTSLSYSVTPQTIRRTVTWVSTRRLFCPILDAREEGLYFAVDVWNGASDEHPMTRTLQ